MDLHPAIGAGTSGFTTSLDTSHERAAHACAARLARRGESCSVGGGRGGRQARHLVPRCESRRDRSPWAGSGSSRDPRRARARWPPRSVHVRDSARRRAARSAPWLAQAPSERGPLLRARRGQRTVLSRRRWSCGGGLRCCVRRDVWSRRWVGQARGAERLLQRGTHARCSTTSTLWWAWPARSITTRPGASPSGSMVGSERGSRSPRHSVRAAPQSASSMIVHANPSTGPERDPSLRPGVTGEDSVASWLATCTHGEPVNASAAPWPWIVTVERCGLSDACRAQFRALERTGRGDELHRALDQACTNHSAACNASEAIQRERLAPLHVLCASSASRCAWPRRSSLNAGGGDRCEW